MRVHRLPNRVRLPERELSIAFYQDIRQRVSGRGDLGGPHSLRGWHLVGLLSVVAAEALRASVGQGGGLGLAQGRALRRFVVSGALCGVGRVRSRPG